MRKMIRNNVLNTTIQVVNVFVGVLMGMLGAVTRKCCSLNSLVLGMTFDIINIIIIIIIIIISNELD